MAARAEIVIDVKEDGAAGVIHKLKNLEQLEAKINDRLVENKQRLKGASDAFKKNAEAVDAYYKKVEGLTAAMDKMSGQDATSINKKKQLSDEIVLNSALMRRAEKVLDESISKHKEYSDRVKTNETSLKNLHTAMNKGMDIYGRYQTELKRFITTADIEQKEIENKRKLTQKANVVVAESCGWIGKHAAKVALNTDELKKNVKIEEKAEKTIDKATKKIKNSTNVVNEETDAYRKNTIEKKKNQDAVSGFKYNVPDSLEDVDPAEYARKKAEYDRIKKTELEAKSNAASTFEIDGLGEKVKAKTETYYDRITGKIKKVNNLYDDQGKHLKTIKEHQSVLNTKFGDFAVVMSGMAASLFVFQQIYVYIEKIIEAMNSYDNEMASMMKSARIFAKDATDSIFQADIGRLFAEQIGQGFDPEKISEVFSSALKKFTKTDAMQKTREALILVESGRYEVEEAIDILKDNNLDEINEAMKVAEKALTSSSKSFEKFKGGITNIINQVFNENIETASDGLSKIDQEIVNLSESIRKMEGGLRLGGNATLENMKKQLEELKRNKAEIEKVSIEKKEAPLDTSSGLDNALNQDFAVTKEDLLKHTASLYKNIGVMMDDHYEKELKKIEEQAENMKRVYNSELVTYWETLKKRELLDEQTLAKKHHMSKDEEAYHTNMMSKIGATSQRYYDYASDKIEQTAKRIQDFYDKNKKVAEKEGEKVPNVFEDQFAVGELYEATEKIKLFTSANARNVEMWRRLSTAVGEGSEEYKIFFEDYELQLRNLKAKQLAAYGIQGEIAKQLLDLEDANAAIQKYNTAQGDRISFWNEYAQAIGEVTPQLEKHRAELERLNTEKLEALKIDDEAIKKLNEMKKAEQALSDTKKRNEGHTDLFALTGSSTTGYVNSLYQVAEAEAKVFAQKEGVTREMANQYEAIKKAMADIAVIDADNFPAMELFKYIKEYTPDVVAAMEEATAAQSKLLLEKGLDINSVSTIAAIKGISLEMDVLKSKHAGVIGAFEKTGMRTKEYNAYIQEQTDLMEKLGKVMGQEFADKMHAIVTAQNQINEINFNDSGIIAMFELSGKYTEEYLKHLDKIRAKTVSLYELQELDPSDFKKAFDLKIDFATISQTKSELGELNDVWDQLSKGEKVKFFEEQTKNVADYAAAMVEAGKWTLKYADNWVTMQEKQINFNKTMKTGSGGAGFLAAMNIKEDPNVVIEDAGEIGYKMGTALRDAFEDGTRDLLKGLGDAMSSGDFKSMFKDLAGSAKDAFTQMATDAAISYAKMALAAELSAAKMKAALASTGWGIAVVAAGYMYAEATKDRTDQSMKKLVKALKDLRETLEDMKADTKKNWFMTFGEVGNQSETRYDLLEDLRSFMLDDFYPLFRKYLKEFKGETLHGKKFTDTSTKSMVENQDLQGLFDFYDENYIRILKDKVHKKVDFFGDIVGIFLDGMIVTFQELRILAEQTLSDVRAFAAQFNLPDASKTIFQSTFEEFNKAAGMVTADVNETIAGQEKLAKTISIVNKELTSLGKMNPEDMVDKADFTKTYRDYWSGRVKTTFNEEGYNKAVQRAEQDISSGLSTLTEKLVELKKGLLSDKEMEELLGWDEAKRQYYKDLIKYFADIRKGIIDEMNEFVDDLFDTGGEVKSALDSINDSFKNWYDQLVDNGASMEELALATSQWAVAARKGMQQPFEDLLTNVQGASTDIMRQDWQLEDWLGRFDEITTEIEGLDENSTDYWDRALDLYSEQYDVLSQIKENAEKQLDAFRKVYESLSNLLHELRGGDLAASTSYGYMQSRYDELFAAANNAEDPSAEAIAAFEGFVPEYLAFMKGFTTDYAGAVEGVIANVTTLMENIKPLTEGGTGMDVVIDSGTQKLLGDIYATLNTNLVGIIDAVNAIDFTSMIEGIVGAVSGSIEYPAWKDSTSIDTAYSPYDSLDFEQSYVGHASGGLTSGISIAGEIGPEWVVPTYEPQRSSFLRDVGVDAKQIGKEIASQLVGVAASGGNGSPIHITVEIDGKQIGYVVADQMDKNPVLRKKIKKVN